MNDKIRQLALQAGQGEPFHIPPEFVEKFARLIVRECADACYKHKDVKSFGIYPIRVAMVTKACSDNIKQHFGVEE